MRREWRGVAIVRRAAAAAAAAVNSADESIQLSMGDIDECLTPVIVNDGANHWFGSVGHQSVSSDHLQSDLSYTPVTPCH